MVVGSAGPRFLWATGICHKFFETPKLQLGREKQGANSGGGPSFANRQLRMWRSATAMGTARAPTLHPFVLPWGPNESLRAVPTAVSAAIHTGRAIIILTFSTFQDSTLTITAGGATGADPTPLLRMQ